MARERGDQIMADNIVSLICHDKLITPVQKLRNIIDKHLGPGVTNLEHMAASLDYHLVYDPERLNKFYENNFSGTFRGEFECLSVGYGGYNGLAAILDFLHHFTDARKYIRQDILLHVLCSTSYGDPVFPCGRIYSPDEIKIVTNPAMAYRLREAALMRLDGWWPPKGIGKGFWNSTGVSVIPFREDPKLITHFFTKDEQKLINNFITFRLCPTEFLQLFNDIKISQELTVVIKLWGHVAWIKNINSYRGGKNRAQSVVWNKNNQYAGYVSRPPVHTKLDRIDNNTFIVSNPLEDEAIQVVCPFPIYDNYTIGTFTFTKEGVKWERY